MTTNTSTIIDLNEFDASLKDNDKDIAVVYNDETHSLKECHVCKYGYGHGGLTQNYDSDRKAGSFSIIINLVGIFTVGVCPSMPWVFAQAGWFGIFVIIWTSWLTWLGSKYLVKALYCVPGHRLYDFTALATHFFGYWVGKLVRILAHFIQICTVGVLVVSILDNVRLFLKYLQLYDVVTEYFKLSALIAIAAIAVPGYFIRTMNDTAVTSVIGSLNVVSICIVCIVQCRPDYETNPPVYDSVKLPTIANGFNLILYCFSGLLNFPHLERTMKYPDNWDKAAFFGILITCLSFLFIGIMGYWAYGDVAEISFYSNLPQTWVVAFLTVMFIIQTYTSCLICMILVVDEERPRLKEKLQANFIISQLIYITVHCLPYLIMWLLIIGIKFFDTFTNVTGSVSGVYFSIVLPVVYYLLSYGFKKNIFTINGFWMVLMVLFGLSLGNYFIYVSFLELLKRVNN